MALPPFEPHIHVLVDDDILDLVATFLDGLRNELPVLRAALASGDVDRVRTSGHRLKGVGGMYGFDWLSLAGAQLEESAKAGRVDSEVLTALESYLARVQYTPR